MSCLTGIVVNVDSEEPDSQRDDVAIARSLHRRDDVRQRIRMTDGDEDVVRTSVHLSERNVAGCRKFEGVFFNRDQRAGTFSACCQGHTQTENQAEGSNRRNVAGKKNRQRAHTGDQRHKHGPRNQRAEGLRLAVHLPQLRVNTNAKKQRRRNRDSVGPAQPAHLSAAGNGDQHGGRGRHVDRTGVAA